MTDRRKRFPAILAVLALLASAAAPFGAAAQDKGLSPSPSPSPTSPGTGDPPPPTPPSPPDNPQPQPPATGAMTPIPGVTKTPTEHCQPGTMQFVDATRKLTLAQERYCNDADWNVSDVVTDGTTVFWRVPFTNGQVNCRCAKGTGPATAPTPPVPPAPPSTTQRTPIPGVEVTPTAHCAPGSQRMLRATRKLTLPAQRYCTDTDWRVRGVEHDGTTVFWTVPFTDGQVDCACTRATAAVPPPATPGGPRTEHPDVKTTPVAMCAPGSAQMVTATRKLTLPAQRYCTDSDWQVSDVASDGASVFWRVPFTDGHVDCRCNKK